MVGGHVNQCNFCVNGKIREKYNLRKLNGTLKIPDRSKYFKKYYLEHQEEILESANNYYAEHQEEKKKYQKEKRRSNPEYQRNYFKKYQKENAEILRAKKRERYHNNVNHRIVHLLRGRFLETVTHRYKSTSALKLLGCTIEEFKKHIESQFQPGMTWENHGFGDDKWHFDHIIPCDAFDLTLEENQIKCFHYTNFQPLWQKDNLSKGSRYDSARLPQ